MYLHNNLVKMGLWMLKFFSGDLMLLLFLANPVCAVHLWLHGICWLQHLLLPHWTYLTATHRESIAPIGCILLLIYPFQFRGA